MEALREMRCVACRSDAPTVTEAEIAELLPQVSEWEIVEQENQEVEPGLSFRRFCKGAGVHDRAARRRGRPDGVRERCTQLAERAVGRCG